MTRDAAIKHLEDMKLLLGVNNTTVDGIPLTKVIDDIMSLLKEQEPRVRCRDCEHSYFASNRAPAEQCWSCGKHGIDVTTDWFCADGERRENE